MRTKKAKDGMVLTNGDAFSSVGGTVQFGVNDSPDNWYEITAEEAKRLQTQNDDNQEVM